jgi:hypothetical protein
MIAFVVSGPAENSIRFRSSSLRHQAMAQREKDHPVIVDCKE